MAGVPDVLRRLAREAGRAAVRELSRRVGQRSGPTTDRGGRTGGRRPTSSRDLRLPDGPRRTEPTQDARPAVEYAPVRDGSADPGEIVWTWVPYEDDPSQGKDRPVLVVGRIGEDVAALALTSRAHDDRHHHALGVWDGADGRASWAKLDRVLRLDPDGIRREGAVLDRPRFDAVVAAWQRY